MPSAQPPPIQRATADLAADATGYGQSPLLPIDPISATESAAPPVPEYVPREVFVAQPRSDAAVQRAEGDDTAADAQPTHDLPTEYQGQVIPVDARPVDPAIKRHMQLTRQREAKVVQNREQRLDKLLSEVPEPPAPEETASHSGRRIRPRGHIGVEYVQTKALADKREPSDHAPSSTPEPTPREPEPRPSSAQRSAATDDDEVSSAPTEATAPDAGAIQRAIEVAETSTAQEQTAFDASQPAVTAPVESPLAEPPVANSPVQRSVSVEEALAFDTEPEAAAPDDRRVEAVPAPIQRAPDVVPTVPFDEPAPPAASEPPSAASDVQPTTDRVGTTPLEPTEGNTAVSTGQPAPSVSPSIQRAPTEPASAERPFDAPHAAPDRQTAARPSSAEPSFQRRDELGGPSVSPGPAEHGPDVPTAPDSLRPTVQRAPDRPGSIPSTPREPTASVESAPAESPRVQRSSDNAPNVTSAASAGETPAPPNVPAAEPPSVQRTPDAPDILPFDAPSLLTEPAGPASDMSIPVQRTPNEDSGRAIDELPGGVDPSPTTDMVTAEPPVQRASDLSPSLPFDTPDVSFEAPASSASGQRAPEAPSPVPFDTPSATPEPRDAIPHADRSVQRMGDEGVSAAFEAPAEDTPSASSVQRTPDQSAAPSVDTIPASQESRDVPPRSTPAIQRTGDANITTASTTPAADAPGVQPMPDAPASLPFDATDAPSAAPAVTPPAIQRVSDPDAPVETDATSTALRPPDGTRSLPFETPPAVSEARPAEQQSPTVAAPPAEPSQPAVMPVVQRAPDTAPLLPFDAPEASPNAEAPAPVQRATDERSSPAAQPDVPSVSASPRAAPGPAVQRTPEPTRTLPSDVSQRYDQPPVSAPDLPVAQPEPPGSDRRDGLLTGSVTESMSADAPGQTAPTITQSPLPFDTPTTAPLSAAAAAVQRETDISEITDPSSPVRQRAVDSPASLPFDVPPSAPASPATAPILREVGEDRPSEVQAGSTAAAASVAQQPTFAVQRDSEVSAPLPFDEPVISGAPSNPPAPIASESPVQRAPDVHETSESDLVAASAETPPASVQRAPDTASVLPFDDLPAAAVPPASQTFAGSVQRRTDAVDGRVFAVSSPRPAIDRPDAHPIGRPRRIDRSTDQGGRRDPVQRALAQPEPSPEGSLPFDPIERPRPPEPNVQRMPDVPSPANPYAGMDLRQAMVAAGMISPAAAPDAPAASEGPAIQRKLSEGSHESSSQSEPEDVTTDSSLDVDQLAEDVMHVLRRRLRNEFDRLTGTNR